jgi:ABC-type bacteriocin/lantibiotic exporter with double-glycine peptidase domain
MLSDICKCLAGLLVCALSCMAAPPGSWLDVPFVKQPRNGCGAASIAMVMQYWQHQQGKAADADSDVERIQRALYSRKAHGIYASDVGHYFQQHGFSAFVVQGEWSDLEKHLEKGRPLIVALKPGSGEAALHFVVVVGVETEESLVLVNDPAQRQQLKQGRSDFEREWKGAGNWTLLAIPREGS